MERQPRFYVYRIYNEDQETLYIGKGSANRLRHQITKFKAFGEVLERFKSEKKAYAREVELIEKFVPKLNRHKGGNGSRAIPVRAARPAAWEIEMDRIGPRVYAARALLRKGDAQLLQYIDASKIEQLRRVADGPWC